MASPDTVILLINNVDYHVAIGEGGRTSVPPPRLAYAPVPHLNYGDISLAVPRLHLRSASVAEQSTHVTLPGHRLDMEVYKLCRHAEHFSLDVL